MSFQFAKAHILSSLCNIDTMAEYTIVPSHDSADLLFPQSFKFNSYKLTCKILEPSGKILITLMLLLVFCFKLEIYERKALQLYSISLIES